MMLQSRGRLSLQVNGESVSVSDIPHLRCPACPEKLLRLDEARLLRQGAFALYRQRYGLLAGDEIRAIRERHQMAQAQLASLLRLGGNTISRWEAGRNVQSAAMDILLRLIRDVPESLRYLRKLAA